MFPVSALHAYYGHSLDRVSISLHFVVLCTDSGDDPRHSNKDADVHLERTFNFHLTQIIGSEL